MLTISGQMAEEIHFKIGNFRNFEGPVTLTLISNDLEIFIVDYGLSTSTNTIYWLVATLSLIVDGRTYGRTYIFPLIVWVISANE